MRRVNGPHKSVSKLNEFAIRVLLGRAVRLRHQSKLLERPAPRLDDVSRVAQLLSGVLRVERV